jgi:hypothetical protein
MRGRGHEGSCFKLNILVFFGKNFRLPQFRTGSGSDRASRAKGPGRYRSRFCTAMKKWGQSPYSQ